jgi:uncharacterized protein YxjI
VAIDRQNNILYENLGEVRGFELMPHQEIFLKQRFELGEIFGFETRNKYEILDLQKNVIGFAAEQQKGIIGLLMRQFFGHWRSFQIYVFNKNKEVVLKAHHPFRWFFQCIEVHSSAGVKFGSIQQRFSVFSKKFDVLNERGMTIMQVSSPFWRIWTFPFTTNGRRQACVSKKWTGLFTEIFTDKDSFHIDFTNPELKEVERYLVLAAGLFIDLQYFEKKASRD